jgi:hypothetical protein
MSAFFNVVHPYPGGEKLQKNRKSVFEVPDVLDE